MPPFEVPTSTFGAKLFQAKSPDFLNMYNVKKKSYLQDLFDSLKCNKKIHEYINITNAVHETIM